MRPPKHPYPPNHNSVPRSIIILSMMRAAYSPDFSVARTPGCHIPGFSVVQSPAPLCNKPTPIILLIKNNFQTSFIYRQKSHGAYRLRHISSSFQLFFNFSRGLNHRGVCLSRLRRTPGHREPWRVARLGSGHRGDLLLQFLVYYFKRISIKSK